MSGNAFDLLSSLGEDGDGEEWETVGKDSKKNKKQQQQQGASSSRQPPPPPAVGPRNSSTNNNTAQLRALKEAALRDMKLEKSQPQQQPKQQQQQQQQQSSNSQQQQPRSHDHKGKPQGEAYYRAFQRCFVSDRTGDVVLRFHKTDIVKVKGTGEVILTSGGYLTLTTMMSMNDALSHVGIKIRTTGGDIRDASSWSIQLPGTGSMAYEDNVVIPARTAADKGRARSVLDGLQGMGVQVQALRPPGSAPVSTAGGNSGTQLSAQRAALVQRQAQVQAEMQQAGRPVPSPVVHAPQSYAARLAANINRQQAQQAQQAQRQGTGAPAGASASGGAAGAGAGAGGAGGASANTSAGEGGGGGVPLPPGGPAQFAARSAALSADAFAQFLSPQTDYIAPSGGAADEEEDEDAEVGGDALAAKFNHLVGGLGAELEEEDDSLLCVMCMERPQETILIPCSHAVLCMGCADCLMAKNKETSVGGACPICRTEVMEVISVAD